jgi:hypothetical protein
MSAARLAETIDEMPDLFYIAGFKQTVDLRPLTGIAIMATFLEHRTVYHAHMLEQQQAFSSHQWTHILLPVREFLAEAGEAGAVLGLKSLGLVQRQLILEATVTAYQDCFLLMTALCVVVMPLVFFIRRAPRRIL